MVPKGGIREARAPTIRVQTITHTILGGPYYNCSIIGPKTLLKLLRPLYYLIRSMRPRSASWRTPFQHCSGTASFTLTTVVPSAPGLPSTSYTQLKGLRTVRFWGCHGLFRLGGRGASGCPVLHILKYSLHGAHGSFAKARVSGFKIHKRKTNQGFGIETSGPGLIYGWLSKLRSLFGSLL